MAALKLVDLASLARLGVAYGSFESPRSRDALLPFDWPELAKVLPDGGLPRGVIELASVQLSGSTKRGKQDQSAMRGGSTTIALAAVRGVHQADDRAWCAWITEEGAPSLYAPAVVKAGVDLDRLLIVRPPHAALARTAVKVVTSGAFDLVIVDAGAGLVQRSKQKGRREGGDETVVVRKLALAACDRGTSTILLTSAYTERSSPLPVALRLEVERRPEALSVSVTKDRRRTSSSSHVVRLAS